MFQDDAGANPRGSRQAGGGDVPVLAERIPPRTTPTWEMELLLSCALVFGVTQLPGEVDRVLLPIAYRLPHPWSTVTLAGWLFSLAGLFVLAGTLVMHLAARGYWIALVGLDSVFPGGIRSERLKLGPHLHAAVAPKSSGMAQRIEAADNRATLIFGVGIGILTSGIYATLVIATIIAVDLFLEKFLPQVRDQPWGEFLVLGVFGIWLLAYIVDRALGRRLSAAGVAGRALRAIFRWVPIYNPYRADHLLAELLRSGMGTPRFLGLMILASAFAIGAVRVHAMAMNSSWDIGNVGLPSEERPGDSDALLPGHYGTQRGNTRIPVPLPFIPDRVVRGPYVELFVPYIPDRDPAALKARCPDALNGAGKGRESRAAIDCMGALVDLHLDGQAVAVRFDAASDPVTDHRGVLAMIPATELRPGRHELTISRRLHPEEDPGSSPIYRIPFWR